MTRGPIRENFRVVTKSNIFLHQDLSLSVVLDHCAELGDALRSRKEREIDVDCLQVT